MENIFLYLLAVMFSLNHLVIIVEKIDIPQQLFPYTRSLRILFGIPMNGNFIEIQKILLK